MKTRNKLLLLLLAVVGAFFNFHCDVENPLQLPGTRDDNEVFITSSGFEPRTLTVSAGTRVKWTNNDDKIWCVESGTPMDPRNIFVSGNIRPGETWNAEKPDQTPYTFPTVGSFDYYCSITGATGVIVVE